MEVNIDAASTELSENADIASAPAAAAAAVTETASETDAKPLPPVSRYRPLVAMYQEMCNVYQHWGKDWLGWKATAQSPLVVVNATMYTFAYSLLTSASFGFLYQEHTNGVWAVQDSFFSAGVTGIILALVGGNPMVLYGQTGPIVLLYYYVYKLADITHVEFGPWVAWIGFWSAIMHWAIAAFGICDFKNRVTMFTEELFALLVAGDYITSAIEGFIKAFDEEAFDCVPNASLCSLNGMANLFLGLFFFVVAVRLGGLQKKCRWSSGRLLRVISEFGALWSLILFTIFSFIPHWGSWPGWAEGIPNRVTITGSWGVGWAEHQDLLPFLKMFTIPIWAMFAAIIPAFLLTVLFYVDQNLSTLAASDNKLWGKLQTPEAYNLDFFWLGVTVLITGFLGLPASSGLIPQNPMHTRALSVRTTVAKPSPEAPEATRSTRSLAIVGTDSPPLDEKIFVVEQRFSALAHSVLLLLGIFLLPAIHWIPTGILWGAFLLLAAESFNAQFVQRVLLCLSSPKKRELRERWGDMSHIMEHVPHHTVVKFSLFQFALWTFLYVLAVLLKIVAPIEDGNTWVMVGALFPVIVCLYAIPIRSSVIPLLFSERDLAMLDPDEAPDLAVMDPLDPEDESAVKSFEGGSDESLVDV